MESEDDIVWGGTNFEFKSNDAQLWLRRMAERGWTAPMWPKDYGGGGLNSAENSVLQSELNRLSARPALHSFGLMMLGPALLEYGNEQQKLEHLPKIVRGEVRWCQGYSEPGSGSDLASLQTRCEDGSDHYLINGQKIWTSYAHLADWCFCLVRTAPEKHRGISFILIDMRTPGIEARPIKLISGASPFCETFFTDVKVPKSNLVGALNGGWGIAKRLLQFERANNSKFAANVFRDLVTIAREEVGVNGNGELSDADLRVRIADHKMAELAFSLTVQRAKEDAGAGFEVGQWASIFKVLDANLNKQRCELMVEASGARALGWSGEGFSEDEFALTRRWLRSRGNSIEGGTNEINLNVIANRILGLRDTQ